MSQAKDILKDLEELVRKLQEFPTASAPAAPPAPVIDTTALALAVAENLIALIDVRLPFWTADIAKTVAEELIARDVKLVITEAIPVATPAFDDKTPPAKFKKRK